MIAKVSAVIVGIGVLGTGSVALAKPGLLGMMPKYTTLKDKTLTGKWVDSHKEHFVDSDNNDDWFDWAFRTRYDKQNSKNKTKFQNLEHGGGKDTDKSLAKACKEAYDVANEKIKNQPTTDPTNDEFLEDNVWKYCSVKGKKTTTPAS